MTNKGTCEYCYEKYTKNKKWQRFCDGLCRDAWHKRSKDIGAQIIHGRVNEPKCLGFLKTHIKEYFKIGFPTSIYFLVKGDDIVYIGSTRDLAGRVHHHRRDKDFDRVFYLPTDTDLLEMENNFIWLLRPSLNNYITFEHTRTRKGVLEMIFNKYGISVAFMLKDSLEQQDAESSPESGPCIDSGKDHLTPYPMNTARRIS